MNSMQLIAQQFADAQKNRIIWDGAIFNVKDFGAIGDGTNDDTDAINRAVEAANKWSDVGTKGPLHPILAPFRAGIVFFPPGIYAVRNISLKSGIIYRGAGVFATRFKPIVSTGYVFQRMDGNNTSVRLGCVVFEDFTISPTDSHFAYTDKFPSPLPIGGIDVSYSSSIYFNRVNILNIDGIGLNLIECYDSYVDNMEIIYVGADATKPAIASYSGYNDLTNAVHFTKVRVENCPSGILIDGKQYFNKLEREMQFVACKFENAPILVKHAFGITFSACHFTPHGEAPFTPYIIIGGDDSDTRGVQFVGCSYISGTTNKRWIFDIQGAGTYDVKILGGSVTGIQTFLNSSGQKIRISNVSAVSCGTGFIKSTGKLRISGCSFYNMVGGDYVISAGNESRILDCDFDKIDKAISMGNNCFSEHNSFKDIYVHAHYVTDGGDVIQRNRYEGNVTKEIEYSTPSLSLVTFKADQLATPAPAGYNEQPVPVVGVSNTYGAALNVTGQGYKYFTNPKVKMVVGSGFAGGETVTLKIQVNYDDGTNAYIEHAFNATGSAWLSDDELVSLVKSRLQIKSMTLYAKTNMSSTAVTASARIVANLH